MNHYHLALSLPWIMTTMNHHCHELSLPWTIRSYGSWVTYVEAGQFEWGKEYWWVLSDGAEGIARAFPQQKVIFHLAVVLDHLSTLLRRWCCPPFVSLRDTRCYDVSVRCGLRMPLDFWVDALEDVPADPNNACIRSSSIYHHIVMLWLSSLICQGHYHAQDWPTILQNALDSTSTSPVGHYLLRQQLYYCCEYNPPFPSICILCTVSWSPSPPCISWSIR
jgi:hypothetical protein